MGQGLLSPQDLIRARALSEREEARFEDIIIHLGMVSEDDVARAHAHLVGAICPDLTKTPGDPRLVDILGVETALRLGILPWKRVASHAVICAPNPETFEQHRADLEALFGPIILAIAPLRHIQTALQTLRPALLVKAAENKVAAEDSCRSMKPNWLRTVALMICAVTLLVLFPLTLFLLALCLAISGLVAFSALKVVSTYLHLRDLRSARNTLRVDPLAVGAKPLERKPVVSIMVPLFNERQIASHLIKRLKAIRYPVELLDVLLVVEQEDMTTHACLSQTRLPSWMRTVIVPAGTLKTKPRALNYALNLCRGSIIGIYDAEDAPDPYQIEKMTAQFAKSAPDVACLQGRLDYYTPRKNWLSRCFTLEYAVWFRIVLPGMRKLGLPVPLGGTTLFFRRAILEKLGGWDAHNVTEDADLGIRLARRGYRTEILDSVTKEEPNCRTWPWVKQRSRWLKGYAMTYAVHMRNPVKLYRELGPKGFFGVQMLFGGTLAGFIFAPLLWSFALILFGVPHPLEPVLGHSVIFGLGVLFIVSEVINVAVAAVAVRAAGHKGLEPWAFSLQLYFPLGSLAAYKALFEVFTKPFYWDKTEHGVLVGPVPDAPAPMADHSLSSLKTPSDIRASATPERPVGSLV